MSMFGDITEMAVNEAVAEARAELLGENETLRALLRDFEFWTRGCTVIGTEAEKRVKDLRGQIQGFIEKSPFPGNLGPLLALQIRALIGRKFTDPTGLHAQIDFDGSIETTRGSQLVSKEDDLGCLVMAVKVIDKIGR